MADLISLEEAAQMLGIPHDDLTEMISKGEIRGFKSGSSWKFKLDELKRVSEEKGLGLSAGVADELSAELDLDDSFSLEDSIDLDGGDADVLADETEAKTGDSPSDTGKMDGEEDMLLAEDDLFEDSELSLADGSDIVDSVSDVDDSDLVLDEDSLSEIGLSSVDSEINLGSSDSGLSLESDSAELSDADLDSLALPEDDSLVSMNEIGSDVQAGDDFMLTPVEMDSDEDTSGSQVIALDGSEIYSDDGGGGLLEDSLGMDVDGETPVLVTEDPDVFGAGLVGQEGNAQPIEAPVAMEPPEKPYTIFQVLSLAGVFLILALSMTLVIDNARNTWNADEPQAITAPVADALVNMVGLDAN
jgi:excisionase family DNA binding protein